MDTKRRAYRKDSVGTALLVTSECQVIVFYSRRPRNSVI